MAHSMDQSHQFNLSPKWLIAQVAARSLNVNGVHLKIKARELLCLWQNGITTEQLYFDFLCMAWKSQAYIFKAWRKIMHCAYYHTFQSQKMSIKIERVSIVCND